MGRSTRHFDWISFVLLVSIALFGVFLILTISPRLAIQQFLYLIIGSVLIAAVSRIDTTVWISFSPFLYVVSTVSLVLPMFFDPIRGARRWVLIGSNQLQPSELMKPFILLAFTWIMVRFPPKKLINLPINVALFMLPMYLIFRQPDLGTTVVYLFTWCIMIFASGIPIRTYLSAILIGLIVLPLSWQYLAPFQQQRIMTFISPSIDPQGAGYNATQAMIAVGSGQLIGRGLGRGTQSKLQFLPEHHTDFIFATLVEEFGLFGGLALLILYFLLLWRIVRPLMSGTIRQAFPFIFTSGVFAMMLSQILINTGMNMGIIPVTGITLPLVSFGGSSVLSVSLLIGILWSVRK